MKDVVSKVTFGFLMAQLLPGAIATLSLTHVALFDKADAPAQFVDIVKEFETACDFWIMTNLRVMIFLFLAVGTGMFIHGIHWTTLARLEDSRDGTLRPVRENWWHRKSVVLQVLFSPIVMLLELLWLAIAPNLNGLIMDENTPECSAETVPQFAVLHDFYLCFGQFYAHMAYALGASAACVLYSHRLSSPNVKFFACIYFGCSLFFLLGRVQLGTLFKAENVIRTRSKRQ